MIVKKCDICGAEMRITTPRYKVIFDGWIYKSEKDICAPCFGRIKAEIQTADTPQTDYERGRQDAWDIAQKVFDSTVTFYEAEDVAKQIDKDTNVRSKESQTKHIGLDAFD